MLLHDLEQSRSLEIVRLVLQKISSGEKVYSLAVGEPVFDTPPEIIEAAYEGMKSGMTHYVSSYGIPEVRSAIARKVKRKNGINCTEENTIFMASKLSIYAIYLALNDEPGSEVLVPDPGYFFTDPAIMAGVKPVPYFLNEDYSLDLDEIAGKITEKTKAIVINTPSNPTGKVYDEAILRRLLDLCSSRGVRIISDEAYEDLVYEKKHFSIGSLEGSPVHVISMFTMSKSYAMTGWRGGYIIADAEFIKLLGRFMDHSLTCFPPFIQHASAIALDSLENRVKEFREDFRKKRDLTFSRLKEINGINANSVEGAFYIFPEYEMNMNSSEVASSLLEKHNVAVLPGSVFGERGEKHLRLSYSGSMDDLREALDRIELFFS